jgi:hypothetical protein
VAFGRHQHRSEQVIRSVTVDFSRINPEINRVEILPITMYQVDDVDAPHQAVFGPAVLALHQADMLRILLVLHTVIDYQVGCLARVQQWLDQLPQSLRRHPASLQKVADCVVAHSRHMLSQVAARIVDWCIQEILDILALGNHAFYTTASAPARLVLTLPEPFKRWSWPMKPSYPSGPIIGSARKRAKTTHQERRYLTLRQCLARLVGKT